MPPTDVPTTRIELVFEGLMALTTDRAPGPGGLCKVHLLDDAPGHTPRVVLQQRQAGQWVDLREYNKEQLRGTFSLNVVGVGQPSITYPSGFFEDVVDLEGPEFYPGGVHFDGSRFFAHFHLNNGRFRIDAVSPNDLILRRGPQGARFAHRRVAVTIGTVISLDQRGSMAVFTNRGDVFRFLRPDSGAVEPCRILILQNPDNPDPGGDHAELYNPEIAADVSEADRFHFHHELTSRGELDHDHEHHGRERGAPPKEFNRLRESRPHAICFVAVLGGGARD